MRALHATGLAIAVFSVASPLLLAQEESIVVSLRAIGTDLHRDGSYGAATEVMSSDAVVPPGEEKFIFVGAGLFARDGFPLRYGLCSDASGSAEVGMAVEKKEWLLDRAPHAWWAVVRARALEVGKIEIDIDWEHWASDRLGTARKVTGDRRRIVLPEGGRHLLDFVDETPGPDSFCFRNLEIEVAAEVREDPRFADRRLAYDLWYEHEDRSGRVRRQRLQTMGKQGETVRNAFAPLRFPVPVDGLPPGTSYDSVLEVSAEIQGRLRPDGRIEVRLSAGRHVGTAESGTPRRGGIGDGGRTVLLVSPDEPIRLEFPPPAGASIQQAKIERDGAPPREIDVRVDHPTFYAGSTDRLILTVRPVY